MSNEHHQALGMLKTALEMEEKGYHFYETAVAQSDNEIGRKIFEMLREDETLHAERIKKIYTNLTGGGAWNEDWRTVPAPQRDLTQVFHDLAVHYGQTIHASVGDIEALNVGLDFEAKSVSFYRRHLALAKEPLEIEFTRAMVAEEETHFQLLDDMRLYLTDPDAWFREKEKGGLDGA